MRIVIEIIIYIHDKNNNGHPTNEEAKVLNELEEKLAVFLNESQTVHAIGRISRNGERDIIYYINQPSLDQIASKEFFDSINVIRPMNITIKKDEKWANIGTFLK